MRLLLVVVLFAHALPIALAGEREATVALDEIVLYAGPGAGMPETMRLRRGQRVRIHHEENGFFAIQPPAGSVSWVRGAYLQFVPDRQPVNFPAAAVIDANGQAKLRPGRLNEPKPLAVERTVVTDGTAVTVVGQKVELDGVKWYPIASPDDDYRYVAKDAVTLGGPAESKFVVQGVSTATPRTATPGTTAMPAATVAATNTRFKDAQAAEQAGDWDRAEKLYLACAQELSKPGGSDQAAEACYAKVHEIREKKRKSGGSIANRTESVTTGRATTPTATERPTPAVNDARWTGPGIIYASSIRMNNLKLFALQSNSQTVLTYLAPGPGIDLSQYSNKQVRVYGVTTPLPGYTGKTVTTVTKVEVE